jgi:hypothetical protein
MLTKEKFIVFMKAEKIFMSREYTRYLQEQARSHTRAFHDKAVLLVRDLLYVSAF